MSKKLEFDFDFGGESSDSLMMEAQKELQSYKHHMGKEDRKKTDIETEEYFNKLNEWGEVKFTKAEPSVFPLNKDYFEKNELKRPANFDELTKTNKFFWIQLPLFIVHGKTPFYKIQIKMDYSRGINESQLIPAVHSAFPDNKFIEKFKLDGSAAFGLGEDFTFKVAGGINDIALPTSVPIIQAGAGGKLEVDAKVASRAGLTAGPFSFSIKQALVTCRFAGEEVLWTITDKDALKETNSFFITILQVPKKTNEVQMEAIAQAHRDTPLPGSISRLLDRLTPKVAGWLKKGSPVTLPPHVYHIKTR